jgi:hypothetical protein
LLLGARGLAAAEAEKPAAAGAAGSLTVHYEDDTVSVDARDTPLSNVLEAIARESKAEISGSPRTDRAVTVHLDRVRLAEALGVPRPARSSGRSRRPGSCGLWSG